MKYLTGFFTLVLLFSDICLAQTISSVSPPGADIAQTLPVTITCESDNFLDCITVGSLTTCTSNLSRVFLKQNLATVQADVIEVPGKTRAVAYFKFPFATATGNWDVTVEHRSGGTLELSAGFSVNVLTDPVIDSVRPASAPWKKKLTMTIYASHTHFKFVQTDSALNNVTRIWLSKGGKQIPADSFKITSSTICNASFTIPDTCETGMYNVNVEQGSGRPTAVLAGNFSVMPVPVLQSVSPDSAAPGQYLITKIKARHSNFTLGSEIPNNVKTVSLMMGNKFIHARTFQPISDSVLDAGFLFDVTAAPGLYSLILMQNNGYFGDTLFTCFRVTSSTAQLPAITATAPDSCPVGRKTALTISGYNSHFLTIGTNLPNVSSVVLFNSNYAMNADSVDIVSDTVLKAFFTISPAAYGGLYSIRVVQKTGYPTVTSTAALFKVIRQNMPLTVIESIPDTLYVDSLYRMPVGVIGGVGGVVSYTIKKMPSGMSFNSTKDTLSWKPTSVNQNGDSLVVVVSESSGQKDTIAKLLRTGTKPLVGVNPLQGDRARKLSVKTYRRSGAIVVDITLPESGRSNIPIHIYDLKGSLLRTWNSAGQSRMHINPGASGLSKGVVIIQVDAGANKMRTPVLIE